MDTNIFIKQVRLGFVERIMAAVVIAFGVFIRIYMLVTPSMHSSSSPLNSPAFFPTIVAYALIVVGICLLIRSFTTSKDQMTTINFFSFLLVLIWVGFAIGAQYIGFILAAAICLALTLLLYGVRKWLTIALVSVLSPTVLYFILGVALGVRFPTLFL